jgi:hypothetical protein
MPRAASTDASDVAVSDRGALRHRPHRAESEGYRGSFHHKDDMYHPTFGALIVSPGARPSFPGRTRWSAEPTSLQRKPPSGACTPDTLSRRCTWATPRRGRADLRAPRAELANTLGVRVRAIIGNRRPDVLVRVPPDLTLPPPRCDHRRALVPIPAAARRPCLRGPFAGPWPGDKARPRYYRHTMLSEPRVYAPIQRTAATIPRRAAAPQAQIHVNRTCSSRGDCDGTQAR